MSRGARARARVLAFTLAVAVASGAGCGETARGLDAGEIGDAAIPDAARADGHAGDAASAVEGVGYADFPMPPLGAPLAVDAELARDPITTLVWQLDASPAPLTHAGALDYCDALSRGGRDDFRLPTRAEWSSILDPTRSPTLDPAFAPAIPDYHWTASAPRAIAPGSAFSVYLGGGETTLGLADRRSAYARCVAGGPPAVEAPHFEPEGADRVRDRGTGLVWSRAALAPATHDEASAACEALGGRLPTYRELPTIVDESRRAPAIDPALFPGTRSERHWTSTVRDAGEVAPWTVDFLDGQTFADEPASARHPARCVLAEP